MVATNLLDEPAHDALDHTGLTGVGGSGGLVEASIVKLTSGNLTTTSTAWIDATGLTITMTTGAVRCLIIFKASVSNNNVASTQIDLAIDGTRQGTDRGLVWHTASSDDVGNAAFTYLTDVLSAGSHTFKIQWKVTANTGTLYAATAETPAILTVIETGLAA